MGLFDRMVGRGGSAPALKHTLFGTLRYSRHDGWENSDFSLWGFEGVQLLIEAGPAGPSPAQENAFRGFREARADLLPRCVAAVDKVRESFEVSPGKFRVTGLSVPSFGPEPQGKLWTLWFELEGDEHFMYGVQSDDDWETVVGFADD